MMVVFDSDTRKFLGRSPSWLTLAVADKVFVLNVRTADLAMSDQFSDKAVSVIVVLPTPEVAEACSQSGRPVRVHEPVALTEMLVVLLAAPSNEAFVGVTEMLSSSFLFSSAFCLTSTVRVIPPFDAVIVTLPVLSFPEF